MLKQQIVIDAQGATPEALAAAIKEAAMALATMTLDEAEDNGSPNYAIYRGPLTTSTRSPNTVYILGTDAAGEPSSIGSRSSSNAAKDISIMESALELSQAVERGVTFAGHRIGALMVFPAPKDRPQDTVQAYDISHITDLAKLDDEDVPAFMAEVPGLVAMLKLAKNACAELNTSLAEQLPTVQFVPDLSNTLTLNGGKQTLTTTSNEVQAGWHRQTARAAVPANDTAEAAPVAAVG